MLKGLKSLFAGIIAGTALGVLFSPKKGTEIRKDFQKEFKKGGTGIQTAKSTLTGMGKEIASTESFQKGAGKVKKEAHSTFKKAKEAAKNAVKKVKDQILSNGQED
mgnify:FL=1